MARPPRHAGAQGMQPQEVLQGAAHFTGVAGGDELEGMPVAPQTATRCT
jgi:hypothetical protein